MNVCGQVLGFINHCVTQFGRRELRQWVLFPLYSRKAIIARQVAVRNLMALPDIVESARQKMRKLPDLVRWCRCVVLALLGVLVVVACWCWLW